MLFSSNVFIFVFLPLALIVYYTLLRKTLYGRNIFLLVISLFFYAWGEPVYVLLMLFSLLVNYITGRVIGTGNRARKPALIVGIALNIAVLFVFKYLDFSITIIDSVFQAAIPLINLALPIGISFYTFQGVSYLIDIYRGEGTAQKSFLNVGLYISFFPQLIAGPIVRYSQIEYQLTHRTHSMVKFRRGVERFICGLAKKILLANNLALVADNAFLLLDKGELSVLMAWLGCIAYTLQIYYDFSGYSDMAIGLGLMFGFEIPENFNYPYISGTVSEFWRRWHMTLQGWFKDYVYIPLGGNRVVPVRHIFNLFFVWFLTGLWHGANWTFIVWGLMYFVLLVLEKWLHTEKWPKVISHIYSLLFVMLGWMIFRANTLYDGIQYIGSMFCLSGNKGVDYNALLYLKEYAFFFVFGLVVAVPIIKTINKKYTDKLWWYYTKTGLLIVVLIISISYMVTGSYNPFIYFNF